MRTEPAPWAVPARDSTGPHLGWGGRQAEYSQVRRTGELPQAELTSAEDEKEGTPQNQRFCGRSLAKVKSMSEETGVEFED